MTVMLFCAVGIVWMAIAMPYSRGWRYLNVRMEDSLSRSNALLEAHDTLLEGELADHEALTLTGPATR
ncbi:hypothetical protein ACFPPF_07385 [Xenophilus aerolatus]|nr:hypothetical protein [Xenophilus aerolatus]